MRVHLVDGTYELFRQHLAPRPGHTDPGGVEIGATRAVVQSMLGLLESGATHIGVATDQIIESFRNDLWDTYKTSAGMDPLLLAQFPLLEESLASLGVAVWPMVDYEADDALASAAAIAVEDPRVEQAIICTPDKDLGQCVGGKVVQLDRRKDVLLDAEGVRAKFGVAPESIPDWLALVGDSADGFPGLPGFGAKTAAALLARYRHIEQIPDDARQWDVTGVRGTDRLAATLQAGRKVAVLFKDLATLRADANVGVVDDWEWRGTRDDFPFWCERFGWPRLVARAEKLAADQSCRVIVLTGAGRGFCAGLDLTEGASPPSTQGMGRAQAGMTVQKLIAGLPPKMRTMPQPIIAAVNGAASGGGLALALASDVRIAATSARFNVAFIRVGLSGCDIGVSWLLPRLVGASRAFELMLTGRLIDATEADRIGLVTRTVPDGAVVDSAIETAELIVNNSPFGVRMTKEVMWSQLEIGSLQAGIDLENRTQVLSSFTGDLVEAMNAFNDKRAPNWGNA